MSPLQWLLLAVFIGALIYRTHPAIRKAWESWHKKKEVVIRYRMLAAVRRRPAAVSRLLELAVDKQAAMRQELDDAWLELTEGWKDQAQFAGGFSTSEKGLSLQAEEDWSLIAFFDLTDYDSFIKCQALLEQDQYLPLRNHCDIRLSIGKRLTDAPGTIKALF